MSHRGAPRGGKRGGISAKKNVAPNLAAAGCLDSINVQGYT